MHDRDGTRLGVFEAPNVFGGHAEAPGSFGEYGESAGEFGLELESPLSEADELELAAELLEISSEEELDQFLGGLVRRAAASTRQFIRSDTGRALTGILRGAARKALPIVGRAAGQWLAPGRGGDLGARWAAGAGRLMGLELEGLSPEDKEFELARQFVRFAGAAAQQACLAPPNAPPRQVAASAVARAAGMHAPGLAPRLRGRSGKLWPRSGRWLRQGRSIVLFGG